ncbi:MAG TPA: hypothetical protein PLM24_10725 [Methanothrix sp.]|nr:hypothetical protein [Methanothrix sp.]HPJ83696.1 hypothetical protein [Methanothrix sp.]HPR67594.1 hypothetical protein [Methanothrix sp.]
MKARVLLPLIVLSAMLTSPTGLAAWSIAGNVTDHSYLYLSGYIDEMKIYQTDSGIAGQKLVVGTEGSGTVARRQTAYVDEGGMFFNEWGVFQSEGDLRNALCAKNYAVGTVISESYTEIEYLIKDTVIFQDDNVSIYTIASEGRGTARLGARVRDGPEGATIMTYGGTYIGDFNIRQEIGSGSALYLPCL